MHQEKRATQEQRTRALGIYSGLLSSFLLGWAPILGKLAYQAAVAPMTLAAFRTVVAALLLLFVYVLFWPRLLKLGWRDLISCLLVGAINGVGSLFYYSGLGRIDASQASLLSTLYAVWVVIFLGASGQPITRLTLLRLAASLLGAALVTAPWTSSDASSYLGAMLMVASAAINGWYIVMGQWVLADVPARSATLYILTGMAVTVTIARFAGNTPFEPISMPGWQAIVTLGVTTAFSRLAMFFSMERLGGVQTAIISLLEMVVSLALARVLLGETLSWAQWLGGILLLAGTFLARQDINQGAAPPPPFNPMDEARDTAQTSGDG
ncbi:MAG: DMT family transporter [Anaerolineae bacterium]|nr:DMT family transporter [Anaerolineae bacterium]